MTISPAIKAKVIELHLQKKGRNEIAREINISQGSVHNILRAYKDKSTAIANNGNQNHSQISVTPVEDIHTESLSQGPVINAYEQKYEQPLQAQSQICSNTAPDMNNVASPTSMTQVHSGVGQTNSSSNVVTPRDGGPLLHFLNENPDSNSVVVDDCQDVGDIDILPTKLEPFPSRDPEMEIQVNIGPDAINQDVNSQNETSRKEPTLPDSEDSPIDWDPDESYQTRFWNRIMDEKRRRQEELQLIQQQRQELNIERQQIAHVRSNIDQQTGELQIREAKLIRYESLIPSVQELQNCGIEFGTILPYITAINQKAVLESIDLKTAANNLVYEVKEYRELGHLRGTIERLKKQISALDAFDHQKQAAVTTLLNLQMAGFSEAEITELTRHVSMWSAQPGVATLAHINGNNGHGKKLDDKLISVGS